MKIRVQVAPQVRRRVGSAVVRELARRLSRMARRLHRDPEALAGLGVRIVDDEEMRRLHAQFLGEDRPTDVLSFPAGPDEPSLGDLVIDWDAVRRQAAGPSEHDRLQEAASLAVHGFAHLLGHDHGTRPQARAMLRLERRACRAAGLPPPVRPYGGRT